MLNVYSKVRYLLFETALSSALSLLQRMRVHSLNNSFIGYRIAKKLPFS